MKLNFKSAHKLIDELEATLKAAATNTAAARISLSRWLETGQSDLRRKSAAALKQIRKKADGFGKALGTLEHSFSGSLGKLTLELEKSDAKGKPPPSQAGRPKKNPKAARPAATPLAKPPAARRKPVSRALKSQDLRIQAHTSGRGRRRQAKRDAK